MPTETFFRLSEEKRERILSAAMEEFAQVRFSLASINRIVKAAGISRGSFYQYFEGKENLYYYIMERISSEKVAIVSHARDTHQEDSLFAPLLAALPCVFAWAQANPLYYRIGLLMIEEDPSLLDRVFARNEAGRDWFISYLKGAQKEGRIRDDVDLQMVLDLLRCYAYSLFQAYYHDADSKEMMKTLHAFFDLMEYGIRNRGGEPNEARDHTGGEAQP